nr:response regulator transcription factor [Delftia acidovorans]
MKILVADDHVIFRVGLELTLDALTGGAQIHAACDFPSLVTLIEAHPDADIAVIDLNMPGMNGPVGLQILRERLRKTPILVLSASAEQDDVYGCLANGASGYVHKGAPAEMLQDAVRVVCAGGVFLPRHLLAQPPGQDEIAPQLSLSPRQQQVFDLLVQGHPNKRIAFDLSVSEGTVKAHVAAIMRRFGVVNRVQLLRAAENAGLLSRARRFRTLP